MTIEELRQKVYRDLDSRGLKNPSIRKGALNNVLEFIKTTEIFFNDKELNLPSDKDSLKSAYQKYKGKVLNSAESSVINTIYEHYENNIFMTNLKSDCIENFQDNQLQKNKTTIDFPPSMIDIEKKLIDGSFSTIHELNEGERVPSISGIYCIKIIEGGKIPKEFGKVENKEIIYIGIASKSLKERLWEEELNHLRPATFFRSIGAMLGFLPPKGSLIGKKNKRNYKFSSEDTEKIKNWMRDSLLVNFVPLPQERLEIVETLWIEKLTPLINIKHNPYANEQLKMARKKCVNWANSKS